MKVLTEFDPWKSRLCTCKIKYSLNPYVGCYHRCIYCYARSYIKNHEKPRAKENFVDRLKRDLKYVNKGIVIISSSTDPYQPLELKYRYTRKALKLLKDFKIIILTKSNNVLRDKDLFDDNIVISFTITTLDENISKKIEPYAPSPDKRLDALKSLSDMGFKTTARIDPIIPYVNDSEKSLEELIKELKSCDVKLITSSTLKVRGDILKKMCEKFPEICNRLKKLYLNGERYQNYLYLSKSIRLKLLRTVLNICKKYNIPFATCRENLNINTSMSCDGSHLLI